jgi:hypothetical protein
MTLRQAHQSGQLYKSTVVANTTLQQYDAIGYSWGEQTDCMRYLGDDIYTGSGDADFSIVRGPTEVIVGPMRPIEYTYPNVTSTILRSSCSGSGSSASGCTDPYALNFDPYATVDDGNCAYTAAYVYGCTDNDPSTNGGIATNYFAGADYDDGSCLYDGCTDPLANNYNASATNDDGSCTYDENVITCEMLMQENTPNQNEPGEFCIIEYAGSITLRVNNANVIGSLLNLQTPVGTVITIESLSTGSIAEYKTTSVPSSTSVGGTTGAPNYVVDVVVINTNNSNLHLIMLGNETELEYKLCITV